jgi:hypothetical protein
MDRERPGQDTGKIELEKILNCLKENHYVFEGLEEGNMQGYMVANFKKDIMYSDKVGNYINDRYIKIKIEILTTVDFKKNNKKNKNKNRNKNEKP